MATQKTKQKCHIHDEVGDWYVRDIRENVCVTSDEYPLTEFEGKSYCLFHLPTQDKGIEKFEEIFRARLEKIDQACAAIEAEFPDDEEKQRAAKDERNISYDFHYVWFPPTVILFNRKFSAYADFKWATFSADADFDSATFSAYADFRSATFSAYASFSWATFSAVADFDSATFSADADFNSPTFSADAVFRWATFSAEASFSWATFSAEADFSSATFSAAADFSSATFSAAAVFERTKFSKSARTEFYKTNFEKDTFFDQTRFRNDVNFNSVIFGEDSDVFFRKTFFAGNTDFQYSTAEGYLRFSNLRQGKKNKFDFQEAAFEKASRISFHTVDLRPHWFVNVDSRKFSFTDIFWINRDWDFWNKNIYAEIDSMAETGSVKQKKRIFEVAARQLAVNAEENNRYEEAAKFRYMAMETRRLEETKYLSFSRYLIWLYKWSSGYGESSLRALAVLIGIWLFFGFLYCMVGSFYSDSPLNIWQSLGFSSLTMLLQKPDPRPASNLTFTLYILEMISAPVQAALLALAIRRKFMR